MRSFSLTFDPYVTDNFYLGEPLIKGKERVSKVKSRMIRPSTDIEDESMGEEKDVINVGQAVDLSESEEEEEESDIRGDFIGWDSQPVGLLRFGIVCFTKAMRRKDLKRT